jgi:TP901 family phage tail tape measure protein
MFQRLALSTAQRTQAIAEASGVLVASGMDAALVDRLLPTVARVATAANAAIQDIARTSFSLADGLRVPAAQMEGALASLVVAGREGRFELRAMAREIPSLSGQLEAMGLVGRRAVDSLGAFLQVAMRNAGTESEAANNFRQFLSRLNAPDFLRSAREMGADIPAVMADAIRRNINPLEAAIQEIRRVTRGDAQRIGVLFTEQQSRDFFLAINRYAGEYLRVNRIASQATPSVIDQALIDQLAGLTAHLTRLNDMLGQVGDRLGNSIGRNLGTHVIPHLERLNRLLDELDTRYPGVLDGLVLGLGGLALAGGALALIIRPIVRVLGLLGAMAVALGPGGAILAGLGLLIAGGVALYDRWQPFRDLVDGLVASFDALRNRQIGPGGVPALPRGPGDRPPGEPLPFLTPLPRPPIPQAPGVPRPEDLLRRQSSNQPEGARFNGRIEVALAEGLQLRRASTETPGFALEPVNRGRMLGLA